MRGIVVGVDGSDGASRALDWAIRQGAAAHLPVTAVVVAQAQEMPLPGQPAPPGQAGTAARRASQVAAQAVSKATGKLRSGQREPPKVSVVAVEGNAARELIRASDDADLLVVGRRGHGGFARLVQGSVSSQVTHHANCPVVIVPGSGGTGE